MQLTLFDLTVEPPVYGQRRKKMEDECKVCRLLIASAEDSCVCDRCLEIVHTGCMVADYCGVCSDEYDDEEDNN